MTNNTQKNESNQEKIKMRKLIVEAPELKEGQSDSSGGIRENGKISVQYKNPKPYVEPTLPPSVSHNYYTQKNYLKDQAKDFVLSTCSEIISMIWCEYGRPLLHAKLHQMGKKAIAHLETPLESTRPLPDTHLQKQERIDTEYTDIVEADDFDNNRIIRFPKRNVS